MMVKRKTKKSVAAKANLEEENRGCLLGFLVEEDISGVWEGVVGWLKWWYGGVGNVAFWGFANEISMLKKGGRGGRTWEEERRHLGRQARTKD